MLSSRTGLELFLVGNVSRVKGNREGATGKSESALGEGRSERENSRRGRAVKGGKSGGGRAEGRGDGHAQRGADAGEERLLIKDLNRLKAWP